MTPDFIGAFTAVVSVEAGITRDQGGLTKYGVSQRAYPKLDIANLTLADAQAIYERDYWRRAACDKLPWPLALYVFDAAVNQGVDEAVKMLQRALGVAQDGIPGRDTISKVAASDARYVASLFMAYRALRYMGTRGFDVDGKGWLRRLFIIVEDGALC